MDFFRLRTLKSHTNPHAVRDRPSLKDGERQFRPGSFHELEDNSNETQTNSNEAKNASHKVKMMVHVEESRNSYVNLSQDSCDKIEKTNWACISSENDPSSTVVNMFKTKQAKASLIYIVIFCMLIYCSFIYNVISPRAMISILTVDNESFQVIKIQLNSVEERS